MRQLAIGAADENPFSGSAPDDGCPAWIKTSFHHGS